MAACSSSKQQQSASDDAIDTWESLARIPTNSTRNVASSVTSRYCSFWEMEEQLGSGLVVRKVLWDLPAGDFTVALCSDGGSLEGDQGLLSAKIVATSQRTGACILRNTIGPCLDHAGLALEFAATEDQSPWILSFRAKIVGSPLAQRKIGFRLSKKTVAVDSSVHDVDQPTRRGMQAARRLQFIQEMTHRLADEENPSEYRRLASEQGLLVPFLLALALDSVVRHELALVVGVDLSLANDDEAHEAFLLVADQQPTTHSLSNLVASFHLPIRNATKQNPPHGALVEDGARGTWTDCLKLLIKSVRARAKSNSRLREYQKEVFLSGRLQPSPRSPLGPALKHVMTSWDDDGFATWSESQLFVRAVTEAMTYQETLLHAAIDVHDRSRGAKLAFKLKRWQLEVGRLARTVWILDPRVQTLMSRFSACGFIEPEVHFNVLNLAAQSVLHSAANDSEKLERVRKLTIDEILECLESGRLLGMYQCHHRPLARLTLTQRCPFASLGLTASEMTNVLAIASGPALWAVGVVLGASAINLIALGVHNEAVAGMTLPERAWQPKPLLPSTSATPFSASSVVAAQRGSLPAEHPSYPMGLQSFVPLYPQAYHPKKEQELKGRAAKHSALYPGIWPSVYQHALVVGPYGPYF